MRPTLEERQRRYNALRGSFDQLTSDHQKLVQKHTAVQQEAEEWKQRCAAALRQRDEAEKRVRGSLGLVERLKTQRDNALEKGAGSASLHQRTVSTDSRALAEERAARAEEQAAAAPAAPKPKRKRKASGKLGVTKKRRVAESESEGEPDPAPAPAPAPAPEPEPEPEPEPVADDEAEMAPVVAEPTEPDEAPALLPVKRLKLQLYEAGQEAGNASKAAGNASKQAVNSAVQAGVQRELAANRASVVACSEADYERLLKYVGEQYHLSARIAEIYNPLRSVGEAPTPAPDEAGPSTAATDDDFPAAAPPTKKLRKSKAGERGGPAGKSAPAKPKGKAKAPVAAAAEEQEEEEVEPAAQQPAVHTHDAHDANGNMRIGCTKCKFRVVGCSQCKGLDSETGVPTYKGPRGAEGKVYQAYMNAAKKQ